MKTNFKHMRRILLTTAMLILAIQSQAQIFGTGQTLSTGKFNLGVMPTAMIYSGENEHTLYVQAGYGLTSGIDLALRLNLLDEQNYLGADLEFALKRNVSISTGFHSFNDNFGLDFTGMFTLPLTSTARFTSGLDMDIIFAEGENLAPLWIPLNFEVDIKRNIAFMLEADIDTRLFDKSYHLISGGLQFYF